MKCTKNGCYSIFHEKVIDKFIISKHFKFQQILKASFSLAKLKQILGNRYFFNPKIACLTLFRDPRRDQQKCIQYSMHSVPPQFPEGFSTLSCSQYFFLSLSLHIFSLNGVFLKQGI